ncbi:tRNA (adenosine(37)-N6)-threonylcarbamoyltransferase complex ATPase subunit type 1 TsaE [Candidatus Gracilibacteria bacterium]|nr:tRNA (adenosine(37)-N6)-threonylcarbamoyltransferase complex ATPase subunit type 1 TsaE [Candidatus Gracilibacteria bacterium]NJM86667.1 tRNA (adenosine(37)-N6)-threonylcarbamoyltransferase complex ATPase subunit type 1 TsaE [Hydrococcus sp. RU_2_2]NJP20579.1 tRNA (adenosine(37)-N6)-threonylcarbamoyltransferase complex ATPase subunit type 1 TsaE [Hydrococcus sp. CRU_1_1]NJQ96788.1 tRNA (adenosine(37)-N6)-threonylcarbamoyltransferase complex ATPase subunit type 1 TsaE [Hydrococcus sp. CSU_1_8]
MFLSLPDAEATFQLGKILGESLFAGTVLLLKGDLGAGKTTLVQGIGEALGIKDPILSPTFTLINEYTEGRLPLYHLDLYRLQPQETEGLYLHLYWEGIEITPGIMAIEWAERLLYLPPNYLNIELSFTKDLQRQAKIDLIGEIDLDLSKLSDRAF